MNRLFLIGLVFLTGCGIVGSGENCEAVRERLVATKGDAGQYFNQSFADGTHTQIWFYEDGSTYEFNYSNYGGSCTWTEMLPSVDS